MAYIDCKISQLDGNRTDRFELKAFAIERPIHYFLIFACAPWDFSCFIPLAAFGLAGLGQAAVTADAVEAVLLPAYESQLIIAAFRLEDGVNFTLVFIVLLLFCWWECLLLKSIFSYSCE